MARRSHVRIPIFGRALAPVGSDFVSVEALGGVALLAATCAALLWANLATASYAEFWSRELTVGLGNFAISEDWLHWVNDGLMTVFFFVVGLEIKRELVRGELRDPRAASLPVLAAVGGMVAPALLYLAFNAGGAGSRGWAIPMATDIAFAVVVLTVLGTRVPRALKLFLLTLAIADDIGAIVVIALFYSEGIAVAWLFGAGAVIAFILCMQRLRIGNPIVYVLPAVVMWVCTLESGVHATIAGVILGLLTPARPFGGHDVIERLEGRLHPWSSLLVIPLFALANVGVDLNPAALEHALHSPVSWGVVIGLVVGKPIGIVLAAALVVTLRLGRLPSTLSFRHVIGASCVAGIGFTVSLFIAELSFGGQLLSDAKAGILLASLLSAVVGVATLSSLGRGGRTVGPNSATTSGLGALSSSKTLPRRVSRRLGRAWDRANDRSRDSAETVHRITIALIATEQRAIALEQLLVGVLSATAALAFVAALVTSDARWMLSAAPTILAGWLVSRLTKRRKTRVADLLFTDELYFGPHSPGSAPPDL